MISEQGKWGGGSKKKKGGGRGSLLIKREKHQIG